jgi:V8-like Glu-specific endopeptidase
MRFALTLLPGVALGLSLSGLAAAQDMPPLPQPGPEHQIFKADQGTWDAVVEVSPGPGAPAMTSQGVETGTVGCGGLCLITEFKGELMPGMTFEGHGLTTWDAGKKKYVGSWTDSMSRGMSMSEATLDQASKTVTGWMEGPDMNGTVTRSKSVSTYPDEDHRVMTMFVTGPDGKEIQTMKITYTRRK